MIDESTFNKPLDNPRHGFEKDDSYGYDKYKKLRKLSVWD